MSYHCGLLMPLTRACNFNSACIHKFALIFVYTALPDFKWQHYRIWKIIGTELGIDVERLDSIERDHINDHDRLLALVDSANCVLTHEMITKVLQSERIANAVQGLLLMIISCSKFRRH